MANSVDPDQTAPIGAVCSGSTLFASILNLSVMLGNYLQQTTSADDIFRCFVLFDLILYVPSTIFHLYRDGSSWVEPVLSFFFQMHFFLGALRVKLNWSYIHMQYHMRF